MVQGEGSEQRCNALLPGCFEDLSRELKPCVQHGNITGMSTKALEQTVTDLQRRVADLEGKISTRSRDGWRKIVGAAKDDTHFAEAMKLGAEWRKKANRENW